MSAWETRRRGVSWLVLLSAMHIGPVGQGMSQPVVANQVAVGRYVHEAGSPVEVVDDLVVLDLAGQ